MKKENIFKEKLYHHTIPVRDGLWDAIEAQLPPRKEQRIFPLFWLTLFSTTLLGGILMFGVSNANKKNSAFPIATQTNLTYNDPQQVQLNSTNKLTEESTNSESSTNATIKTSADNTTTANTNTSATHTSTPVVKGKKKGSKLKTVAETTNLSTSTQSNIHLSADNNSSAFENSESDMALLTNHQKSSTLLPFLPQQDVSIASASEAFPSISMVKPDPNCYKFSNTGSKLALSVDAFAGPGFSPKKYIQNDTESSIYADARQATENYQYAWSAGARLNLQHRSGFTGRIGLTYTQVGDVFDYTDSLATQSTTRIDSFFAADGTFLYTETSQVLILGTLIKKIHNTYRYLDVPLIIGYEMPLGRSTVLVNAGPVFNLSSSHEGQILDPNLHPRSIKEGDPGAIDVYKSNIGLSLYLGAGYLFPLSDHFSGLIEPSFIYRLDPVTLDSYPLQEQRHYANLNLGIRYHIH